jgi:hypothetical protein
MAAIAVVQVEFCAALNRAPFPLLREDFHARWLVDDDPTDQQHSAYEGRNAYHNFILDAHVRFLPSAF